uniref:Uncharacterized protein n=1 Tax=Aquisalinus luteolus TaxID=1566827 RepID=A0A8J3A4X6_9PROT|nr:hypothetical protein GCM10011355_27570 [Aquisalinus luteolus]
MVAARRCAALALRAHPEKYTLHQIGHYLNRDHTSVINLIDEAEGAARDMGQRGAFTREALLRCFGIRQDGCRITVDVVADRWNARDTDAAISRRFGLSSNTIKNMRLQIAGDPRIVRKPYEGMYEVRT